MRKLQDSKRVKIVQDREGSAGARERGGDRDCAGAREGRTGRTSGRRAGMRTGPAGVGTERGQIMMVG